MSVMAERLKIQSNLVSSEAVEQVQDFIAMVAKDKNYLKPIISQKASNKPVWDLNDPC